MKDGLPSDNGAARTSSFNTDTNWCLKRAGRYGSLVNRRDLARARLRAQSQTSPPNHGCGSNTLLLTTGHFRSSTAHLDCPLTHRWATNKGLQKTTDWGAFRVGQKRMEEDRAIHSSWGDPRYSTSASPCCRCFLGRRGSHVAFFFSHSGVLMKQLRGSIRRVGSILHSPGRRCRGRWGNLNTPCRPHLQQQTPKVLQRATIKQKVSNTASFWKYATIFFPLKR